MSEYRAPLEDMRFVLRELVGLERVASLPGYEEADPDVVDAILDEAARFAGEVLSPLNRVGDLHGAQLRQGEVTTAPGFREAYRSFVEAGWNGLAAPQEFGGQGLPRLLAAGADPRNVFIVSGTEHKGEHRPFDPAKDMDALRHQAV